ncbi:MAG: type II secretion system protein GspM [Myxococcota bacterium]
MNEWLGRLRSAWDRLSARERLLVSGVGGLFGLLVVLLGIVNPLLSASERARERARAADQELSAVVRMRGELDEIQGRLAAVERRIQEGPRREIFTTLETLAGQSGVKVDSMEPQTAPSSEEYKETKVQVVLRGVSLAQLANYLFRIESSPQLLSIKSLRVRTRPDASEMLDVNFSVSSFEEV